MNLQINLDIDNEQFTQLCVENINDLPKDKVEELLLKAVEVALIRDKEKPYYETGSSILVQKSSNGYGCYRYEPTQLLKDVMGKVDLHQYVDVLANHIKDYIENNYEEIIKKYVVESFANMIFSDSAKYSLRNDLINDVNNMLSGH